MSTALSAGSASTAAAQDAEKPAASASRPEASPRAAKDYDFPGDAIDGTRTGPDGTTIFGLDEEEHPSLIRLREHFIADIIESTERL